MAMFNELESGLDSGSSSDSRSVDERSALLPGPFGHVPAYSVREEQVVEETIDNTKSTSKLVYIMVGLWIGTFCAGLGKPQLGMQSFPLPGLST